MKIIFFIPSLKYGGAERVTSILANELVQDNKVYIITEKGKSEKEYIINNSIDIIRLSSNKKISMICEIRNLVKKIKPDICVIMFAPQYSYIFFSLLGINTKIIVSERNDPSNFSGSKINKFLYQRLIKFSDGIVFQTYDAMRYYYPNGTEKAKVIPNPIIVEKLPKKYLGERRKVIVNVGRLHEQKNQILLIKAFYNVHKIFSDYKLYIFGDGELYNYLNRVILDLNASDYIVLKGSTDKLFEQIYDASLFVLTSNYEGMPNALIEALCLGIPCISSDCPCGGPRELIQNKVNGELVKVNDLLALQDSIVNVLSNRQIQETYSTNAYKLRSKLDSKLIVRKWLSFITKDW